MFSKEALLVSALTAFQTVYAVVPQVALNYSTYVGTAQPNGISQWLGMRFAAPPLGNLRFAAPQDPVVNTTVQMATSVRLTYSLYGCIQELICSSMVKSVCPRQLTHTLPRLRRIAYFSTCMPRRRQRLCPSCRYSSSFKVAGSTLTAILTLTVPA